MPGVDGAIALSDALDRLASVSRVAANAPRGVALCGFLQRGISGAGGFGDPVDYLSLASTLIQELSIWWPISVYAQLPVLVPWAIRDRSARYDMGPEMWSAPREDGFVRDDNSLIKKLPLPLRIKAPAGHPYNGQKPWRGFMACHVWRRLPDGGVAGTSPWLYSFVPNLVWLPMPIARLSDIEGGPIQHLLQRTSVAIFREATPAPSVAPYCAAGWARLPEPPEGATLKLSSVSHFVADQAFVSRRIAYIDRFIQGSESVLSSGRLKQKLLSSRYTEGFPQLDRSAVMQFADLLGAYRSAVVAASETLARTGR